MVPHCAVLAHGISGFYFILVIFVPTRCTPENKWRYNSAPMSAKRPRALSAKRHSEQIEQSRAASGDVTPSDSLLLYAVPLFQRSAIALSGPRPLALFAVYDKTALTPKKRLSVLGSGVLVSLAELLCNGVNGKYDMSTKAARKLMNLIARRVVAGQMAATPEGLFQQALKMYAAGQYAAAACKYQSAVALGHLRGHAELSWLMLHGREGVPYDNAGAYRLVAEGHRLGCAHCAGILAWFIVAGSGTKFRHPQHPRNYRDALNLATDSAECGSRYGQLALSFLCTFSYGVRSKSLTQARDWVQLAADQGLDMALQRMGWFDTRDMKPDTALQSEQKAFHHEMQAALQGFPSACYEIAYRYEKGVGVTVSYETAILWYRRAIAAGDEDAPFRLDRLQAKLAPTHAVSLLTSSDSSQL